jgi:glycosyltransferase involved in cell wall biosynthesis
MQLLIVGNFDFRADTACSIRVRGLACALQHAGHRVAVVDSRPGASPAGESWTLRCHPSAAPVEGTSIDEYADGMMHRAPAGLRGLFLGDVAAQFIRDAALRADAIILYGTQLSYLHHMRGLARDMGALLLLDVVEWYGAADLPGGRFGPFALANSYSMRRASLRADGHSVISKRLAAHYAAARRPLCILPPMFEPSPPQPKLSRIDGRIHFAYAGSPGRKEAIGEFLAALRDLDEPADGVTLHLVGLRESDLRALSPQGCGPTHVTRCYGRVPNAQARAIVASCDFSLLLRPPKRSNQFGFPSKLAESMAVGTPTFANLFSDLADVLEPGRNALIVDDLSRGAILDGLQRSIAMEPRHREAMARAAHETAATKFSPASNAPAADRWLAEAAARFAGSGRA